VLHIFCFVVIQLPGLIKLKIVWLLDFNQEYIKISGSYILSFQTTNILKYMVKSLPSKNPKLNIRMMITIGK